jgi:hypothetical protein
LRFMRNEKGIKPLKTNNCAKWSISHPNDLKDLRPGSRNRSFRSAKGIRSLCRFFRLVEAQNARERNQRRIRGARGVRRATRRLGNGLQAVGIAQNGLRKCEVRPGKGEKEENHLRRFAHNLRRESFLPVTH